MISSSIQLNALKLDVFLGWPDAERMQQQTIFVDVHLRFPLPPKACISDDLQDTFCYDTLVKQIKTHLGHRHFRLLEYLGQDIYQCIKQNLQNDILVKIHLTKQPAIENLTGGVTFFYGDE